MPIRLKLTAALAIPIAALLVVAALEVVQSRNEGNEVREQTELAEASIGPGGLISNLQHERNYGSVWLMGFEQTVEIPVEDFEEATSNTDESLEAFRRDIESKGGDVEEIYAPAFEALDRLPEIRRAVTEFEGERVPENQPLADPMFQQYTEIITALFEANTQVALAIDDPTLRRGAELLDLASRQTDAIARLIREFLLAGLGGGLDTPEEIADASAVYGEVLSNQEAIRSLGNTGPYREITQRLAEESDSTGFVDIAAEVLDTGEVPIEEVLGSVSIDPDFSYYGFRQRAGEVLQAEADKLTEAAQNRQLWYLGLAVLAILVALVVTWLISRSITQPLRSLTQQAKQMAEQRLPDAVLDILETPLGDNVQVPNIEPVTVRTRDEVADVADALNTVQDSALDLAVEQAVLRRNIADSFVNLGRRNQNLLGRQLDFITELESNETDPDTLASLFRLDHLATRMRRNAESLLVLAGIDPPRKWAAPVRLTDVIRAALGEVEDYQRVTVRGVEPATILGSAAADLAHLLAEFIENALTFSPPDQNVDIRGRHRPDGHYTLAVIDSGLGMPPNEIAQANRRLAGAESFTIAPSKYLGHYVAGNLAARHGIHLQLDNSPGNGITATIDLPPSLLTTEAPAGDPITPPHGSRPVAAPAPDGATGAAGADGAAGSAPTGPEGAPVGAPAAAGAGAQGVGPGAPAGAAGAPTGPGAPAVNGAPIHASPDHGTAQPAAGAPAPNGAPMAPAATAAGIGRPGAGAVPGAPTTPAPPQRTASGLVKRSPRVAAGPRPSNVPDDDLLATLSNYANSLPKRRDPILPGSPGPMSSMRTAPPQGYQPPPQPQGFPTPGPAAPPRPAPAQPSTPTPPSAPAAPPAPAARQAPASGGNPAWTGLGSLDTGPQPVTPSGPETPRPRLDPTSGGTTASGLARRVKGAQLPNTQPLSLRRSSEHATAERRDYGRDDHGAPSHAVGASRPQGNGGAVSGDAVGGDVASGDNSPAKDVYSFLSSFTAGVQRGLDEARRSTTTPEDEQ
ncbi:MAG TPA: nitrate- and nitrite sensing domain-containing protein [Acidimicrobiales bacterium]